VLSTMHEKPIAMLNIARKASIPKGMVEPLKEILIYQQAFLDYVYIALAVSVLMLFLTPMLKRMIGESQTEAD